MDSTELDVSKRFERVKGTPLTLNTETGFYYVRQCFRRERLPDLFATTKAKTIRLANQTAKAMIDEHRAKYMSGGPVLDRGTRTVADVIDEIFAVYTPTQRAGTQAQHKIYLGELRHELGGYPIGSITLESWSKWLTAFKTRKKRKTFFDYQKHMNIVLNYAHTHGRTKTAHLVALPNPDHLLTTQFRVYKDDEITALWGVMREDTRDQFILSYECMMRLREMLKLTWDRVDLNTGVITLRKEDVKTGSKTGKGRSFVMSPDAWERMKRRNKKAKTPFVFPARGGRAPINQNKTAWIKAKENSNIAKPKRARWHDLRHTAISNALLVAKVPITLVSEYVGTSVITLQRIYLHSQAAQTVSVSHAVSVRKA